MQRDAAPAHNGDLATEVEKARGRSAKPEITRWRLGMCRDRQSPVNAVRSLLLQVDGDDTRERHGPPSHEIVVLEHRLLGHPGRNDDVEQVRLNVVALAVGPEVVHALAGQDRE